MQPQPGASISGKRGCWSRKQGVWRCFSRRLFSLSHAYGLEKRLQDLWCKKDAFNEIQPFPAAASFLLGMAVCWEWRQGGFIHWYIWESVCWDQHCTYLLSTYHTHWTNRPFSSYEANCPVTSTASIRSFRANSIRSVLGQIRTHFHTCAIQSCSAAGRKFSLISLKNIISFLKQVQLEDEIGDCNWWLCLHKEAVLSLLALSNTRPQSTARGLQWVRSPRTFPPKDPAST